MTAAKALAVRTALESELSWRRDEVRHLRNTRASGKPREASDSLRRATLVMLYAHLEGFSKFALEQYATAINDAQLSIGDLKSPILAACLIERFKAHRSSDLTDPADPAGNRARQVMKDAEFIQDLIEAQKNPVKLNVDLVTSADSNLSQAVLRRNLAMLALDDSGVHKYTSALEGLLKLRNNIAHGERLNLPSDPSFVKLENRIFDFCEKLLLLIYQAVRDEEFRRPQ